MVADVFRVVRAAFGKQRLTVIPAVVRLPPSGTSRHRTKVPQQPAIEASVNSQTLRYGQHRLPVSERPADIFGNMQRGQQHPLLLAGRAIATLPAGEGDEHLVLAVEAANSSKAFLQITAPEKGGHRPLLRDDESRHCFALPEKERPTEFSSEPDSSHILLKFERVRSP